MFETIMSFKIVFIRRTEEVMNTTKQQKIKTQREGPKKTANTRIDGEKYKMTKEKNDKKDRQKFRETVRQEKRSTDE
jgi:hypothetical protein